MPKSKPMVEIILPFHRVDDYLLQAIKSIKESLNVQTNVIAVNDTGARIEKKEVGLEQRDRLIQTTERGYLNALKEGVKASSSEYVAFLDSDDLIHPSKLFDQINLMNEKKLDFVSCGITKINSNNQIIHSGSLLGKNPSTANLRELWIIGSHGADSTLLCQGNLLREYWFNHEKFQSHFADYGWALSLPKKVQISQLDKDYYFYRSHPFQISKSPKLGNSWQSLYPLWKDNVFLVFPNFPRQFMLSERESLVIAFPASMLKLKKYEIKNLINFEKALINCLSSRDRREKSAWKKTLARRILIASRGTSLRHWHVAPSLISTLIRLRLSKISLRKMSS